MSKQEPVHDRSAKVSALVYLHKIKPRTAKTAINTRSPDTMPAITGIWLLLSPLTENEPFLCYIPVTSNSEGTVHVSDNVCKPLM